jgi:hypothetical protein
VLPQPQCSQRELSADSFSEAFPRERIHAIAARMRERVAGTLTSRG